MPRRAVGTVGGLRSGGDCLQFRSRRRPIGMTQAARGTSAFGGLLSPGLVVAARSIRNIVGRSDASV